MIIELFTIQGVLQISKQNVIDGANLSLFIGCECRHRN